MNEINISSVTKEIMAQPYDLHIQKVLPSKMQKKDFVERVCFWLIDHAMSVC